MNHAGSTTLANLEPLLERLRRLGGLSERKRGMFYIRSSAFLHFHEDLFLTDEHAAVAGRLFTVAAKVARQKGVAESGFRLATNAGPDANQTVFHFHMHCIGDRKLGHEG